MNENDENNNGTVFITLPDLSKLNDKEKKIYKFIKEMNLGIHIIMEAIKEVQTADSFNKYAPLWINGLLQLRNFVEAYTLDNSK